MQTPWIVAGLAALGLAAAAPWGVGYYTEQQWQGVESGFNHSQNLLRLETREYDRGYMSASVRGSITFTGPDSGEPQSIDYRARVSHGVTGSLMDFSTGEDLSVEVRKLFPEEKPRLTLETRVWGTAAVELTVPEVNVTDEVTGETLNIAPARGRADIGAAGTELDIAVAWPGMTATGPEAQISLTDFRMDQTMELLSGNVWVGDVRVTLASLQVEVPEQQPLVFEGLTLTSESDATADGQRLKGDSSIRLDRLLADGEASGPHNIQIRFEDLHVASLEAISSAVSDMQQATLGSTAGTDSRSALQQQMTAFQALSDGILMLAAEGFSFGFPTIDLNTAQGPVTGELVIRHPALSGQDKAQAMLVMQGLTGRFDLSLPTALVEDNASLAMQVAPLIKQGMVVREGDRLRMTATLKDMALDINGNLLPLPPLF